MDQPEHDDFLDSDLIDQSKGLDEKLTDLRLTTLGHVPSAFTQRGQ